MIQTSWFTGGYTPKFHTKPTQVPYQVVSSSGPPCVRFRAEWCSFGMMERTAFDTHTHTTILALQKPIISDPEAPQ